MMELQVGAVTFRNKIIRNLRKLHIKMEALLKLKRNFVYVGPARVTRVTVFCLERDGSRTCYIYYWIYTGFVSVAWDQ